MRKGFDGLSALVQGRGEDVYSGHLFVFVSRRGDRVKVLTCERGGFVLWHKRLERGRFRLPALTPGRITVEVDAGELSMLLDGVGLKRVRRPAVWTPPAREGIDRRMPV